MRFLLTRHSIAFYFGMEWSGDHRGSRSFNQITSKAVSICFITPQQTIYHPRTISVKITPLTNILPYHWFRAYHMICLSFTRRRPRDSASFAVIVRRLTHGVQYPDVF